MKTQTKIPDSADGPPRESLREPPRSAAVEARPAANEEFRRRKRPAPLNPLWVINIAMAAFFIVAALAMMTS